MIDVLIHSKRCFLRFFHAVLAAVFIVIALGCVSHGVAKETLVNTPEEFNRAVKSLSAGDTIVMADGNWSDFEMVFKGFGTSGKPITLRAQTPGKVILTGRSNLRLAGEYLSVSGLTFKHGYTPSGAVISFRTEKPKSGMVSKYVAFNSRLTNVVIDGFSNPERFETDYWVALYGKNNRVDHNHFSGKRNKGVLLAVRLDDKNSQENHHRIDHNYFGPRPILGANGGETLRIGTSHYSLTDSFTVVENNFFDRCDGELEIISVKSGKNEIRGNVFFESRGTLTLRHGNNNIVEDNVFFGNGVDHTGGIRVINEGQVIRNNYLEGLAGYRFGGAVVVMNGVPNSAINRYHQVKRALIENNSIINSDHIQFAAGSDEERSARPIESEFKNNLVHHQKAANTFTIYDDISGIKFHKNIIHSATGDTNLDARISSGFISKNIALSRADNGLLYPIASGVGVSRTLTPIDKSSTGVSWYSKPDVLTPFQSGRRLDVRPGLDSLANALDAASDGDTLVLAAGDYMVTKSLSINKTLSIVSANIDSANARVFIEYGRKTLFEVVDGGSLHLQGLTISGGRSPDDIGNSVIRTHRYSMLRNYRILIEDSQFDNLNVNHSFNFLDVAKGTMANSIDIVRSKFSNVTGSVLNLDKETDDYGIYNAEYVNISDSTFENIGNALVEFYRGGTDESTFGPHFLLHDSVLDNVGRGKRNSSRASLYLHGVQVSSVSGNTLKNSQPISVEHTVGEPRTSIVDNVFYGTSAPLVVELNSSKSNTADIRGNALKAVEK